MSAYCPSRRGLLAASVAAALTLPSGATHAVVAVTNCADTGDPGDLRHTIANAASSEIVDLTACSGSTISVQTTEIPVPQNDLTILGPGVKNLTINGNLLTQSHRIFNHTGTGNFTVKSVALGAAQREETVDPRARGGCIYSLGYVTLDHAGLYTCVVTALNASPLAYAFGAGVFAVKGVVALHSTIHDNRAYGSTHSAAGGGIATHGFVNVQYSTISANRAVGAAGAQGAGICLGNGASAIVGSTISGNIADFAAGVDAVGDPESSLTVVNSTISGNQAASSSAGMLSAVRKLYMYNTTIAFNTVSSDVPTGAAGIEISGPNKYDPKIKLESTLITKNFYGSGSDERDLSTRTNQNVVSIGGSHDLITRAPGENLPIDTLQDDCPRLGPLRRNGGLTLTHALLSHSPALDVGTDIAVDPDTSLPYGHDQRGSAATNGTRDYPRESGIADIGAYELDRADAVFVTDFEGC